MPGVVRHTLDSLRKSAVEAADAGLAGVMIFGIPAHKDALGSAAVARTGSSTSRWGRFARKSATTAW